MVIKILGSGCPRCVRTYENAKEALKNLGKDAKIEKVEDIEQIMSYGVMATPAVVINEKLKGSGKIFFVAEMEEFIKQEL